VGTTGWFGCAEERRGHGGFIQQCAVGRVLSDPSQQPPSHSLSLSLSLSLYPSLSHRSLRDRSLSRLIRRRVRTVLPTLILSQPVVHSHRRRRPPGQHRVNARRRRQSRSFLCLSTANSAYSDVYRARYTSIDMTAARRPIILVVHLTEPRRQRAVAAASASTAAVAVVAAASIGRRLS